MPPPLLQIREIDDQHADILARLAAMRTSTAMTADWYARFEDLLQLSELCRRHFSVEESLMRLHRFDGVDRHAGEHREYLLMLDALLAQAAREPTSATAVDFMERWWDEHIRSHDRAYADWFSSVPARAIPDSPFPVAPPA